MALIKCPECGKEISSEAKNCIRCGFPLSLMPKIPSENSTGMGKTGRRIKITVEPEQERPNETGLSNVSRQNPESDESLGIVAISEDMNIAKNSWNLMQGDWQSRFTVCFQDRKVVPLLCAWIVLGYPGTFHVFGSSSVQMLWDYF